MHELQLFDDGPVQVRQGAMQGRQELLLANVDAYEPDEQDETQVQFYQ